MAYFAHLDVWEEAAWFAQENGCVCSVYIDEVTISGPKVTEAMIWQIKEVIGAGLRYQARSRSTAPALRKPVLLRAGGVKDSAATTKVACP
jgi:hypothetical protein